MDKKSCTTFEKGFSKSELENEIETESNLISQHTDLESQKESLNYDENSEIWGDPDSDDDYKMLSEFDIDKAWKKLLSLHHAMKIPLSLDAQKKLKLEIGKNVTQEYPWKQIKFKDLIRLFDDDEIEMENLKNAFQIEDLGQLYLKFSKIQINDLILVGYLSTESDEDTDYFLFYGSHESAKKASKIIENIEKYEHWLLNRTLFKTKKKIWCTKNREETEIDDLFKRKQQDFDEDRIDVEFQSVYPIQRKRIRLTERNPDDVRDGYVELVPASDKKFENIYRRRINVGIQSSQKQINLEQQTNPTFPSNAWSQYLYEIDGNEKGLDKSDDDDADDGDTKEDVDKKKEKDVHLGTVASTSMSSSLSSLPASFAIELSKNFKYLMKTIEFNQVDMYRNDYEFISTTPIEKHKVTELEEIFNFANISKSINRIVAAVDWYPTLSGVLVASYAFTNLCTPIYVHEIPESATKTTSDQHPVLMWNVSDNLEYTFEFEAQREVTALSFCPYDDNLLIGGTINGTIIIWDLQNRLKTNKNDGNSKNDDSSDEILNETQLRNRLVINNHLIWTKQFDENRIVYSAAVSSLQGCQNAPITSIKWLDRNHTIAQTGQLRKMNPGKNRYFLTSSLDGTIAFWHVESSLIDDDLHSRHRQRQLDQKHNIPPQLMRKISSYKKYDRLLKPIFIIDISEPITNILIDASAEFNYEPLNKNDLLHISSLASIKSSDENLIFKRNYPVEISSIGKDEIDQDLHVSTLYGQILSTNWSGLSQPSSVMDITKEKLISSFHYAEIHDGPIIHIERNKFIPNIFVTIGGTILGIWYDGYSKYPLAWRQIDNQITQAKLSNNRPAVLYLTTSDGTFQIWDMLYRTELPTISKLLGGGIISLLSEPPISIPNKIIGIGDYNSTFKIYNLPIDLQITIPNEKELVESLLEHVKLRKSNASKWQKNWIEKNADIIEAKNIQNRNNEKEKNLERIQKEIQEIKIQQETKDNKTATEKKTRNLTEVLQKQWDEYNLKRIIEVLLQRQHINPEKLQKDTLLEKELLKYKKLKKDAIKNYYEKIDNDLSEIRSKLLPIEKVDLKRIHFVDEKILNIILDENNQIEMYDVIEKECNLYIDMRSLSFVIEDNNRPDRSEMLFNDFYKNGIDRRHLLNRSLSSDFSYKRREYYEKLKLNGKLSMCDFGKMQYLNRINNLEQPEEMEQLQQQQDEKNTFLEENEQE